MASVRFGGFRILLVLILLVAFGAGGAGAFVYLNFLRDLPDLNTVADYKPPLTSFVYDRKGRKIAEFSKERRVLVPVGSLPKHVGLAFVAAEDSSFYEHAGIDYVSIVRAAWVDMRAGRIEQGASTITMQLVKQMLLSPERRFSRKLREMVLAKRIESHFSKEEILYLYMNQIYFGSGAHGIGEAAQRYFGKPAAELTISESALLAGLPQRPTAYSPFRDPELADNRRRYALGRMHDEQFITTEEYEYALANPPILADPSTNPDYATASYFTEEVRRYLYERLGGDEVLTGGLTVETTMDIELQNAAVKAIRKGLEEHDHRRGYRGPIEQVAAADVPAKLDELAKLNGLLPDEPADDAGGAVEAEAPEGADAIAAAPELPIGEPLMGIVLEVNEGEQWARIGFAPGIEGQAALEDVSWAREPELKRRPRPVKKIAKIFAVGDVVQFVRLEGEPLAEVEAAKTPGSAQAPAPLARLDIYQHPEAQAALISMEVGTGDVRAIVGGYDYENSEFNRATQARRQPGSAFKPFIYGAALSREYTPVSILWDRPVVYEDPVSGFVWHPENYSKHFYGRIPLRQALVRSVNNATVHLFRDVGVDYVIDYARRLGIQAPLQRDLSLALGSSSVGLVELTSAYAVFPNQGRRVIPRFISRVLDRDGKVLLEDVPLGDPPPPVLKPLGNETETVKFTDEDGNVTFADRGEAAIYPDGEIVPTDQIISAEAAYLMCDLMQAVVQDPRGTGWRLRDLKRPVGGKTGTTNDQKDAWFMGFSPDVVTGVWVGRDDSIELGWSETGSRAAAPIWVEYMATALEEYPKREFEEPEHIVTLRIDRETGLIAGSAAPGAYFQPFLEGTEPEESVTTRKTAVDTRRAIRDDFF